MQHNSKYCLLKCLSRKSHQISNICNFTSWYTAIPQWSLDHNSSLKLVDLAGHTNVFQIIKKRRSKGLINNPFMTRKFCTFVTTEILYIFSIKAILLRFWDVTQDFFTESLFASCLPFTSFSENHEKKLTLFIFNQFMSCCKSQTMLQISEGHKCIQKTFIIPSNFFVSLTASLPIFSLYILISSDILQLCISWRGNSSTISIKLS